MSVVSMKSLLEAGVHFGHQTRRWNPKMAKFIFAERNGIYIIDLQKTVRKIDEAYEAVKEILGEKGSGGNRSGGKTLLNALCKSEMAWRNAHQFQDYPPKS